MARYNEGFGIAFNDNDGGATYFISSSGMQDYKRHVEIMGRWRAKLFFFRKLYLSLQRAESFSIKGNEPRWKRLNGWKA